MASITVARAYDKPTARAGHRVLVDRLWPRGVGKVDAPGDEWCKAVAPSAELRRWYGHVPERFEEFRRRYRVEMDHDPAAGAVADLRQAARRGPVVLVTATKDVEPSGARVLAERLRRGLR